jgi:hypothetical protein
MDLSYLVNKVWQAALDAISDKVADTAVEATMAAPVIAGRIFLTQGHEETATKVVTVNGRDVPYTLTSNKERCTGKAWINIGKRHITVDYYAPPLKQGRFYEAAINLEKAATQSTLADPEGYFTRIRAPFVNTSGLRFRIYRRDRSLSFFDEIRESLFSTPDISIGDAEFDRDFVI